MSDPTPKSADFRVLQNGVPRSGNVWLQYLIRDCFRKSGETLRQYVDQDPVALALRERDLGIREIAEADFVRIGPRRLFLEILDIYRWPIADVDELLERSNYLSSHSGWNAGSGDFYDRFSHLVYLIRDPRDVALSLNRFAFTPFNRLQRPVDASGPEEYLETSYPQSIRTWVAHVGGHVKALSRFNLHVVFYERLVSRPEEELGKLASFLGFDLDESALAEIIETHALESMRERQPDHVHKGQWGRWREELSPERIHRTGEALRPLLTRLGYPVTAEEAADWKPENLGFEES